ncbi:hypothetical protein DF040_30825 [Burkholderia cenocepacia]|nr:hypothetical protein DF040_30825 [Burkholderia cenocepacia]
MKRQVPFWSVSCAHPPSRRAPHCGGLVLDMKPILGIAAAKRCIDSPRVCKGGVNAPCGSGAQGGKGMTSARRPRRRWMTGWPAWKNRRSRGSLDSRRAPFGGFRTLQESRHSASRNQ